MKKSFGSMTVEPGTKSKGFLEVTTRIDGTPVHIPLIVLNGEQEGPTLVVDACVHGNEIDGALAIIRLVQTLDPKKLKGTLVCAPYLNPDAVLGRERGSRFDTWLHDGNRYWPGRANGSITERLLHKYFSEVVSKADCMINIHSAGGTTTWFYNAICREEDERAMKMVLHSGISFISHFKVKGAAGARVKAYDALLVEKGITKVGLEMPGAHMKPDELEETLRLAVKYLANMMKTLDMVEGKPESLPESVCTIDMGKTLLRNNTGGFCIGEPTIKMGDHVKKGTNLATIVNAFGEEVERVDAPFDGILMGVRTYSTIFAGEYAAILAPIIKTTRLTQHKDFVQ